MTDDPIGDELHRLSEEFKKLVSPTSRETTTEDLAKFGLTSEEAKAWLRNEPNFALSDVSYHDKKSDDKSSEPRILLLLRILLFCNVREREKPDFACLLLIINRVLIVENVTPKVN